MGTVIDPNIGTDGIFDKGLPESGLAVWWVREGTWSSGHDEVRLVDANSPDIEQNLALLEFAGQLAASASGKGRT